MPATFLQQCNHTLVMLTGMAPWANHIHQNRDKHVRHPQVDFVGQTIQSRRIVEADLLQRVTDFAFSHQTLAACRFRLPKVGEVG